jgi:hypothetical protein
VKSGEGQMQSGQHRHQLLLQARGNDHVGQLTTAAAAAVTKVGERLDQVPAGRRCLPTRVDDPNI